MAVVACGGSRSAVKCAKGSAGVGGGPVDGGGGGDGGGGDGGGDGGVSTRASRARPGDHAIA